MNALNSPRIPRPGIFPRWSAALVLGALAAAAVLSASIPPAGAAGPIKAARRPGIREVITLSNGAGAGRARVQVDAFGEVAALDEVPGIQFFPVGGTGFVETTYYSGVWFSGAGQAGQGGNGDFLGELALEPVDFSVKEPTRAVSEFTIGRLRFQLTQELLTGQDGSTFRQQYVVTNTGTGATNFDLIRHMDGDLAFRGGVDDFAGATADGQTLFEFEDSADLQNPSTFVGIDLNGDQNIGYRVAKYNQGSETIVDQIESSGRAVLNNTIDGDQNGDRLTDTAFDVTLNQGQTFSLAAGRSATFVTRTILGRGVPADVITSPSDLKATALSSTSVELTWADNSNDEQAFLIERRDDGVVVTGTQGFRQIDTVGANVERYLDNTVFPNSGYTYRVRANLGEDNSGYSNEASVRTPNVLARPTDLAARVEGTGPTTRVVLTWVDNASGEGNEAGFEVERTSGKGGFGKIHTTDADVNTFTDGDVTEDTTFTYRVRAIGQNGPSGYSNEASATTPVFNRDPRFVAPTPNGPLTRKLGERVRFEIRATDANPGDTLTLTSSELPGGATVTPELPTEGNPVTAEFIWDAPVKGIHVVTFTVTDPSGATDRVRISINIEDVGTCAEGAVAGTGVRFKGSVGYPRGSRSLKGHMRIQDRKRVLVATRITNLSITGNVSTIEGVGKINGIGGHTFRMVVQDNGSGARDRLLSLQIDEGALPAGALRNGDIHFHSAGHGH